MKPTKEEVIKAIKTARDLFIPTKDNSLDEDIAYKVMKLCEEKETVKPDGFTIKYTVETGTIEISRIKMAEHEFLGVLEQIKYGVLSKSTIPK